MIKENQSKRIRTIENHRHHCDADHTSNALMEQTSATFDTNIGEGEKRKKHLIEAIVFSADAIFSCGNFSSSPSVHVRSGFDARRKGLISYETSEELMTKVDALFHRKRSPLSSGAAKTMDMCDGGSDRVESEEDELLASTCSLTEASLSTREGSQSFLDEHELDDRYNYYYYYRKGNKNPKNKNPNSMVLASNNGNIGCPTDTTNVVGNLNYLLPEFSKGTRSKSSSLSASWDGGVQDIVQKNSDDTRKKRQKGKGRNVIPVIPELPLSPPQPAKETAFLSSTLQPITLQPTHSSNYGIGDGILRSICTGNVKNEDDTIKKKCRNKFLKRFCFHVSKGEEKNGLSSLVGENQRGCRSCQLSKNQSRQQASGRQRPASSKVSWKNKMKRVISSCFLG